MNFADLRPLGESFLKGIFPYIRIYDEEDARILALYADWFINRYSDSMTFFNFSDKEWEFIANRFTTSSYFNEYVLSKLGDASGVFKKVLLGAYSWDNHTKFLKSDKLINDIFLF